jgi:hypothetical protein
MEEREGRGKKREREKRSNEEATGDGVLSGGAERQAPGVGARATCQWPAVVRALTFVRYREC